MKHVDVLSRFIPVCMLIDECDGPTIKFKQAQQSDNEVKNVLNAIKRENVNDYVVKNLLKEKNDIISKVTIYNNRFSLKNYR